MLHLFKLHTGMCPHYVGQPFVLDYPPSWWHGGLQAAFALPERPDVESVRALLDFEHLERRHTGGGVPVAGIQMTISAPKCVSIAALVGGDHRLLAAHEQAVMACLEAVELLVCCRVTKDGYTERVISQRTLMAGFRRFQSRAGDPHLHTHVILFTTGEVEHGQWRAVDSQPLWKSMHYLGAVYQSCLAELLQGHGYTVQQTDGLVRIAEVPPTITKRFSNRADQIKSAIQQVTGKAMAELRGPSTIPFCVNSAPKLPAVSFEERVIAWRQEGGDLEKTAKDPVRAWLRDFTAPQPRAEALMRGGTCEETLERARQVIHSEYTDLRSPAGGIAYSKLLCAAFIQGEGALTIAVLEEAMAEEVQLGIYTLEGVPAVVYDQLDHQTYRERQDTEPLTVQSEPAYLGALDIGRAPGSQVQLSGA